MTRCHPPEAAAPIRIGGDGNRTAERPSRRIHALHTTSSIAIVSNLAESFLTSRWSEWRTAVAHLVLVRSKRLRGTNRTTLIRMLVSHGEPMNDKLLDDISI